MDGYYAHTLEKKDGMGLFLGMILFLHSLTKSGKLLLLPQRQKRVETS